MSWGDWELDDTIILPRTRLHRLAVFMFTDTLIPVPFSWDELEEAFLSTCKEMLRMLMITDRKLRS